MQNFLKRIIYDPRTDHQKLKIKRFINNAQSLLCKNNLDKLAKVYGTDKWGAHSYTPHYKMHLQKFKKQKINLLEIGIGGYDHAYVGGYSLEHGEPVIFNTDQGSQYTSKHFTQPLLDRQILISIK